MLWNCESKPCLRSLVADVPASNLTLYSISSRRFRHCITPWPALSLFNPFQQDGISSSSPLSQILAWRQKTLTNPKSDQPALSARTEVKVRYWSSARRHSLYPTRTQLETIQGLSIRRGGSCPGHRPSTVKSQHSTIDLFPRSSKVQTYLRHDHQVLKPRSNNIDETPLSTRLNPSSSLNHPRSSPLPDLGMYYSKRPRSEDKHPTRPLSMPSLHPNLKHLDLDELVMLPGSTRGERNLVDETLLRMEETLAPNREQTWVRGWWSIHLPKLDIWV